MELPTNPSMLLSVINMKLRDQYDSLDNLCDDMDISKEDLLNRMTEAGFEYNSEAKKFW